MDISIFTVLAMLFNKNGYRLYMVGGTARDYLLKLPLDDFDLVTDATPSQMELFLSDGDYRYANYGNVKLKIDGHRIDITTLREEASYKDYRHPQSVSFVTDIALDYPRRDFTINGIYIDEKIQIHDFDTGVTDLYNKVIKMIGEPNLRLQEDPLRIVRALRFKLKLDFEFDDELKRAIINNIDMLEYLKPSKVNSEIEKMMNIDEQKASDLLLSFGLKERY